MARSSQSQRRMLSSVVLFVFLSRVFLHGVVFVFLFCGGEEGREWTLANVK